MGRHCEYQLALCIDEHRRSVQSWNQYLVEHNRTERTERTRPTASCVDGFADDCVGWHNGPRRREYELRRYVLGRCRRRWPGASTNTCVAAAKSGERDRGSNLTSHALVEQSCPGWRCGRVVIQQQRRSERACERNCPRRCDLCELHRQ